MSRILILSDLHMHGGNPMSPQARSYLSSDDQYSAPEHNPLSGIEAVLKSENLSVDWLVCAGDVADQGNRDALRKGWSALAHLKSRLRARLISTVGNHDLDSRRAEPNEKPNSVLRALTPLFPVQTKKHCTSYWADDVAVVDDKPSETRVVIVNSCAFHGLATSLTVEEFRHGRITRDSLKKLRNIVKSSQYKKNLLLVHHHLRPHPEIGADVSIAVDGAFLLDVLASSSRQWLVIHGHEHLSYLGYEGSNA
jgi:predicted MPP superfamily phosphohydrolase